MTAVYPILRRPAHGARLTSAADIEAAIHRPTARWAALALTVPRLLRRFLTIRPTAVVMALVFDVAGLTLLSVAAGMIAAPAGIAFGGVACLILGKRIGGSNDPQ
jgi:hypothetical protein